MNEPLHYLSTAQVAKALRMGVSTVKRWVDDGVLPAYRTPGGHRKLLLADVLRLAREGKLPQLDWTHLAGATADNEPTPSACAARLTRALLRGDEAEARQILQQAFVAGMPLTVLADDVVAPALARVGHGWESGKIDVMHEHHATQIVFSVLFELKAALERPVRPGRPTALGGAPEGDPYLLGSLVGEMVLLELGWDVVNLGPNTPLASLARGLRAFRPRLLFLSVSYLADVERFEREYADLYRKAERRKVPVALGGNALTAELRARLSYTTHGDGMAHLAAFARMLHPPPEPPPRGRPPKNDGI